MKIATLTLNPFGVNTYVLIGSGGSCVIVDPAASSGSEREQLRGFITSQGLTPTMLLNTHAHIDHVCGVRSMQDEYSVKWGMHPADAAVLGLAESSAQAYGFEWNGAPVVDFELCDDQEIDLDGEIIKVLHTPGHSTGGVCFHIPVCNAVITGDTLFQGSIGRTDLPTGDYDVLMKSIFDKLLSLDPTTQVLPGHGPHSTIGIEAQQNPFITDRL